MKGTFWAGAGIVKVAGLAAAKIIGAKAALGTILLGTGAALGIVFVGAVVVIVATYMLKDLWKKWFG